MDRVKGWWSFLQRGEQRALGEVREAPGALRASSRSFLGMQASEELRGSVFSTFIKISFQMDDVPLILQVPPC